MRAIGKKLPIHNERRQVWNGTSRIIRIEGYARCHKEKKGMNSNTGQMWKEVKRIIVDSARCMRGSVRAEGKNPKNV